MSGTNDNSHLDALFHQERMCGEMERQRPFMLLQPRMEQLDGTWFATYWGVVGSGDTPSAAAYDFDAEWLGTKTKP